IYVISEQLEPLNENNKQINNTYKSKILDMAISELNNNSFLHKNEKKVLYNFNDILKIFNDDLDSKVLSSPIINTDDEYEGFQSISD
ncbi:MAG: hypothetical protein MHPSP_003723, partial [Paramarteilia canceri]